MKTLIFITIALFLLPAMNKASEKGHEYAPLIDTAALWNVHHYFTYTYTYKFMGDTLIDTLEYKKLYYNYAPDFSYDTAIYYAGCMRENLHEGKVYYKPPTGREFLLYDFGLEVGDTIIYEDSLIEYLPGNKSFYANTSFIADSIDSMKIHDEYRKVVYINGNNKYRSSQFWIEGIGSSKGIIEILYEEIPHDGSFLLCYHNNGRLYYKGEVFNSCYIGRTVNTFNDKKNEIKLYPNPARDNIMISVPGFSYSIYLFDTRGNLILVKKKLEGEYSLDISTIKKGIYILSIQDIHGSKLNKKVIKL